MSDGTNAVPDDALRARGERRALCPGCHGGRLHPYVVQISLGGLNGYDYGSGWVAVCVGSKPDDDYPYDTENEPCGFSMPLTARKWNERS